MFQLHEKLKEDLLPIKETEEFLFMLHPNSENPWAIIIPKVKDARELHHLSQDLQIKLLNKVNILSKLFENEFKADKINVGALGNMVPQLHIHVIARYKNDKAWPGAIWGTSLVRDERKLEQITEIILKAL